MASAALYVATIALKCLHERSVRRPCAPAGTMPRGAARQARSSPVSGLVMKLATRAAWCLAVGIAPWSTDRVSRTEPC
jgi:hypothetical protein